MKQFLARFMMFLERWLREFYSDAIQQRKTWASESKGTWTMIRQVLVANRNHPVIPAVLFMIGSEAFFVGALMAARLYFTPAVTSILFKGSVAVMCFGAYLLAISVYKFSALIIDFIKGMFKAFRAVWVAAAFAAKG